MSFGMSSKMVVWSIVFGYMVWGGILVAEDWPGFLGSRRDGKSDEIGIVKDWSGGQLEMAWDLELGEGYGIGSALGNRFFAYRGTVYLQTSSKNDAVLDIAEPE